jgi:hypothetical protein
MLEGSTSLAEEHNRLKGPNLDDDDDDDDDDLKSLSCFKLLCPYF